MDTDIQQALDRFTLGTTADSDQRQREEQALRFQVPDMAWPDDVKDQRKPQIVGGVAIPQRPMLSIPTLDQPIQMTLNAEKAAHLGIKIHPISETADDKTAEIIQGLYRRIEVDSRAGLARSWAFERAVKAGRGFYRVLTEADPDGGSPFDQKITIKRILQQGSVVLDPFAQEPDWSDGQWAFLVQDMPWETYKRRFPKSKMAAFSEDELSIIGVETPKWISGDPGDAGRAVRVAEYYRLEHATRTRVLLDDGTDAFDDEIPEGRTVLEGDGARSVEEQVPTLWWSVMNAIEELEPAQTQDGRYIPIVPVLGRELIPFEQQRRWVGIIEPNKDAVRLLNYSASSAVELAALESKAPYTMVEGQEEGHEQEWQLANVRNFPYLRYRNVSLNGTPAPPPQRTQVDTSRLGPSMVLLDQARDFIHQGTGAYEPALGQQTSSARSGKAVLALQQQFEHGSSHFLDSLAEVSLTYEAKVILDLIPHIYDRPGRVARVLDMEDEPKTVLLNTPFQAGINGGRPRAVPAGGPPMMPPGAPGITPPMSPMGMSPGGPGAGVPPMPPGMPQGGMPPGMPPRGMPPGGMPAGAPGQMGAPTPPEVLHYDLKKGRYGVVVTIGRSYKSRTQEGADEMGQLFQANPSLFPILGDLYLKFRDFPGHNEAAERIKKLLPPPLQDPSGQPTVEQLQSELQEQGQMLEQLTKALDEKTREVDTESVKQQAITAREQADAQVRVELERMKNETDLAIAEMKVKAAEDKTVFEAEHKESMTTDEQSHDRDMKTLDAALTQATKDPAIVSVVTPKKNKKTPETSEETPYAPV
jgi:hypothetical protein|tara:strand:- start:637 stop:3075 length:2439 start_codon:yes stop_codon:yes gene_type:complete